MNRSGEIIPFLKKEEDFSPSDVILIYDDIDLSFGTIKVSFNRGDGGHNGVKSITSHMGTKKTIRIRIGVSQKNEKGEIVKPNVLSSFSKEQREFINKKIAPKVYEIINSIISVGLEKTMNIFNAQNDL
jgi:PTH1 family peptidyl-tRNA hydrolase